jgi:hypothetical protein
LVIAAQRRQRKSPAFGRGLSDTEASLRSLSYGGQPWLDLIAGATGDEVHIAHSVKNFKLKVRDHDGRTPGPFRTSPGQELGHHTLFARHSSGQTVAATYGTPRSRRYHP